MNAEYSKSKGPDWCSVTRIPTQTTWTTIDNNHQRRRSRVATILKDIKPVTDNPKPK